MISNRLVSLIVLLVLSISVSNAQWQMRTPLPSSDVYSVTADGTHVYVGGLSAYYYSSDDGNTWQTISFVNTSGQLISNASIQDIVVLSATDMLACGSSSAGGAATIWKSTDGGAQWLQVHTNTAAGPLRAYLDLEEVNANMIVAVGRGARRATSTDGGNSWTDNNGLIFGNPNLFGVTSSNTNEVHFVGGDEVFQATNNLNGIGPVTDFPGEYLRAVNFENTNDGIIVGEDGFVANTSDGGTSWSDLSMPGSGNPNLLAVDHTLPGVWFAAGNDGIYRTTSSGQFWEYVPINENMIALDIDGPLAGYCLSDQGNVYGFGGSANYFPIANFDVQGTLCPDTTITLLNLSDPNYTNQWFLNGQLLSSSYNATFSVPGFGQADTVMLVVDNGTNTDTLIDILQFQGTGDLDPINVSTPDSICWGSSFAVTIQSSQSGSNYRLLASNGWLSAWTGGTGSDVQINTNTNQFGGANLSVIAERGQGICGFQRDTVPVPLTIGNPDAATVLTSFDTLVCYSEPFRVLLPNSQQGVSYQFQEDQWTPVGTVFLGNGGPLWIETPPLYVPVYLEVHAISSTGCESVLNQTFSIAIENPQAYFGFASFNIQQNSPAQVLNGSTGNINSYDWDFGPGATPANSNSSNPGTVSFSQGGSSAVTLIVGSPQGCVDTLTQAINTLANSSYENCDVLLSGANSGSSTLLRTHWDGAGNNYVLRAGRPLATRSFNNLGDTLEDPTSNLFYPDVISILKYDANGTPAWISAVEFENASSSASLVDASSNTYLLFNMGNTPNRPWLRIHSSNGRVDSLENSSASPVLCKFDPNGVLIWYDASLPYVGLNPKLSVRETSNGDLIITRDALRMARYSSAGQVLWTTPVTGVTVGDFDVPTGPQFKVLQHFPISVYGFDQLTGTLVDTLFGGFEVLPLVSVPIPQMPVDNSHFDENGNLYLQGRYRGQFVVGNDTILYDDGFTTWRGSYVLKLDANYDVAWIRTYEVYDPQSTATNSVGSFQLDVVGNHVIISGSGQNKVIDFPGYPATFHSAQERFYMRLDTAGNNVRISTPITEDWSAGSGGSVAQYLSVGKDTSELAINEAYANALYLPSDTSGTSSWDGSTTWQKGAVVRGDVSCLFASVLGPNALPVSNFSVSAGPYCAFQPVQFQDASLNGPILNYSWTFSDGVPNSSSMQNPLVYFNTPGYQTIELVSTNSNGISAVYVDSIFIDVCTGLQSPKRDAVLAYPNPVSEKLNVNFPEGEFEFTLLDVVGKLIVSRNGLGNSIELEMSEFSRGVYFYQVLLNGERYTGKVQKN